MRLIITRPEEDSRALSLKLRNMGHEFVVTPLLKIVAKPGIALPNMQWAAMVITSANAVRCLPAHALNPDLRVIAVGAQSAQAARSCGFHNVESHGGDVHKLADWIAANLDPTTGPLLYVTGREISGDLAGLLAKFRFQVERIESYQAEPQELMLSAAEISTCDGVLLYSPRSAKLWVSNTRVGDKAFAAAALKYFCLSPAVAQVLPQAWDRLVASEPNQSALLQLLEPAGKGE